MPHKTYFASIDGLRLIASINIVLFHLERGGALDHLHGSPGWLFALIKGPAFHASLFFIIGGFIYGTKFAGKERSFNTWAFFRKRMKALYPLHAVTTGIMIALLLIDTTAIDMPRLILSATVHLAGLWAFLPQSPYMLNSPAWALSAFFLCYLLLGPMIRLTARLRSRKALLLAIVGAVVPIVLWSLLFCAVGTKINYHFFHIFAPIRFFEFVLGMLLARMYLLNPSQSTVPPFVNDVLFMVICICLYFNVRGMSASSSGWHFFRYHTIMVPLYAILVYRMFRAGGCIASFFALKPVRSIGMSSFYPYLLHIPLSALTCTISKKVFHVNGLFHEPVPLVIFMILLYIGSALAWGKLRTGRSSPPASSVPVFPNKSS